MCYHIDFYIIYIYIDFSTYAALWFCSTRLALRCSHSSKYIKTIAVPNLWVSCSRTKIVAISTFIRPIPVKRERAYNKNLRLRRKHKKGTCS